MPKFLTNIDLASNELLRARVENSATAPLNPGIGQIYYNTTDKVMYQFDGTNWSAVGSVDDVRVNGTSVLDTSTGIADITNVPATIVSYSSTQNIKQALDAEVNRATTAEAGLQEELDSEGNARAAADTALQASITAEKNRAEAAELLLQDELDSEGNAREAADIVLQGKIDAEEARAIAAETALSNELDSEGNARAAADTVLQSNINAEKARAEAAESLLQDELDSEGNARSAADAVLQGEIDGLQASKVDKEEGKSLMSTEEHNKLAGIAAGAEVNVQSDWDQTDTTADDYIKNKIVSVDNVTSTDTKNPLSANQGKLLNDRITNLESRGRFLSLWICTTGKPETDPTTLPYNYRTGDWFRIKTIATDSEGVNYMPDGAQYTGAASTKVCTDPKLKVGDIFWYDGTSWLVEHNQVEIPVTDVQINGTSIVSDTVAQIPVDQTYGSTSANAQSGIAVAEAIEDAVFFATATLAVGETSKTVQVTNATQIVGVHTYQGGSEIICDVDITATTVTVTVNEAATAAITMIIIYS